MITKLFASLAIFALCLVAPTKVSAASISFATGSPCTGETGYEIYAEGTFSVPQGADQVSIKMMVYDTVNGVPVSKRAEWAYTGGTYPSWECIDPAHTVPAGTYKCFMVLTYRLGTSGGTASSNWSSEITVAP